MAKTRVIVSQTFEQIATGAVVVTVDKQGDGALLFNETATEDTAYKSHPEISEQFQQTEAVTTFVRATGDGWELIADGVL